MAVFPGGYTWSVFAMSCSIVGLASSITGFLEHYFSPQVPNKYWTLEGSSILSSRFLAKYVTQVGKQRAVP